jgi:4-aminobutyrate aminotransferase-like enzyme
MGLLQALELVSGRESRQAAPEATNALMEAMRERGVLVGKGGLRSNCLRLSPPMNIGRDDVDQLVQALDESLREL